MIISRKIAESKKVFEVLIKQGNKRIKKLKRIRRENTTEMILEPIKDLESEPYKFNTKPPSWDENSLRELAKNNGNKNERILCYSCG